MAYLIDYQTGRSYQTVQDRSGLPCTTGSCKHIPEFGHFAKLALGIRRVVLRSPSNEFPIENRKFCKFLLPTFFPLPHWQVNLYEYTSNAGVILKTLPADEKFLFNFVIMSFSILNNNIITV